MLEILRDIRINGVHTPAGTIIPGLIDSSLIAIGAARLVSEAVERDAEAVASIPDPVPPKIRRKMKK